MHQNLLKKSKTETGDTPLFEPHPVPKDPHNIVFISFFLFGIGAWMAWNSALAGLDYFSSRFEPKRAPSFMFGFVYFFFSLMGSVILIFISMFTSLNHRVFVSIISISVLTFSLPFITENLNPDIAWYLVLSCFALTGVFNAFILGDITGYSSMFPDSYLTIMFVGQGISGLVLNAIKVVMIIILPPDIKEGPNDMNVFYNSVVFLTIGLILFLSNLVLFQIIKGFEFTKYYSTLASPEEDEDTTSNRNTCHNISEGAHGMIFNRKSTYRQTAYVKQDFSGFSSLNSKEINEEIKDVTEEKEMSQWEALKKTSYIGIQLVLTFIITFGLYPGTLVSTYFDFLEGTGSRRAWFNIIMITLYAGSCTLGRISVSWIRPFGPKTIIFASTSRLIFFATSILIQLGESPTFLFKADWFKVLNVVLFSFTSGHISACLIGYAPAQVSNINKPKVGKLMNFMILAGSVIGTTISAFGLSKLPQFQIDV